MKISQNLTLDVAKNTLFGYRVQAKSGDINSRTLKVSLTDNGKPVTIPSGTTATYRVLKPDGKFVDNPATVSGNDVTFTLSDQALAVPGECLADVVLRSQSGEVLSSATFVLLVGKSPIGEALASFNEFLLLESAVKDSKVAAEKAINAAAQAAAAEKRAAEAAAHAENIIDDSAFARVSTHSSDHIYELACAAINETAPVVSCHPVEGYPMGVVSHIAPLQGETGTPSPSNVRPFFPVAECKTVVCGKNLAGDITVQDAANPYNAVLKASKNLLRPGQTVTISFDTPNTGIECYIDPYCGLPQSQIFMDGERHSVSGVIGGQKIVAGYVSVLSRKSMASGAGSGIITNVQIELGSSETPYEPYHGQDYTVRLPGGTYGGDVDWKRNQLIVNRVRYSLNGTENITRDGYGRIVVTGIPKIFQREQATAACSHFSNVSTKYENVIYFADTGLSAEAFTKILQDAAATDQPVTIVSASKEVRREAITPSGIPTAIPGLNNVYSDAGDTTVVAPENPSHTTKKLMDRIAALEAALTERSTYHE